MAWRGCCRRAHAENGDSSSVNPNPEYQSSTPDIGVRHRFSETFVGELIYSRTGREGRSVGYNDHTRDKITLETTFELSDNFVLEQADVESSDPRGEYDRLRMSDRVYWDFWNQGRMMLRNARDHSFVAAALAALVAGCGGGGGSGSPAVLPPTADLGMGPAICNGSIAADFSCSGIDLRSRVPLTDMGGSAGNDIWGWADPLTGNEYALMGMANGTAFVDVTNPEIPEYLGILPTRTVATPWRDIKVYQDHAFIVADASGAHGMQVFDLTRLRDVSAPQTITEDAVYGDFGNAHNLAINEDTGFAYAAGSNTCEHGLHMIDIRTPKNPLFAGCHDLFDVHDAQCVLYSGPDPDYANAEICANSAGDRVEFVDVSNKSAPVSIASIDYPQRGYVHQGWFTDDHRFLLIGDELDERNLGVPTRTHIIDALDLDAPVYVSAYEGPTTAIDHNLYILSNRVFEANYTSGLRVLEFGDLANSELNEVAFFDTYPGSEAASFDGAWSVYPYLPSGNILVSDTRHGLFVLTLP